MALSGAPRPPTSPPMGRFWSSTGAVTQRQATSDTAMISRDGPGTWQTQPLSTGRVQRRAEGLMQEALAETSAQVRPSTGQPMGPQ